METIMEGNKAPIVCACSKGVYAVDEGKINAGGLRLSFVRVANTFKEHSALFSEIENTLAQLCPDALRSYFDEL